ncbi:MAG: polysaccharide pyruvyl transferase CsaB [Clostridia bacterium]|nr:polysaccharide pyruvyl transferase CsaB [Clostridia bacterium]
MKVIHLIGGGDIGGAKVHVLSLVKQLNSQIEVKIISFRQGIFAEEAKELGLDVQVIRNNNILKDIRQTISLIKKNKYDLIHCHGAKGNVIGYFCKRATKLPTITTIHSDYKLDYMHSFLKKMTIGILNSFLLRRMDAHIAVTENFRNMLISRGFNANRIYPVCNGLDFKKPVHIAEKKDFLEKYHIKDEANHIYVGIVARLNPVKSIDTLIKAASLVKKANGNIKFLIAGEGDEAKNLKKLAATLDLNDTVYFLGWLKDPYELMSVLDISVLTSISEGFPYSLLEGAMFKLASISTDVGGISDLVEHDNNGYLFKPNDIASLVTYILDLSSDNEKRTLFGERLYQKALKDFSIEKMASLQLHAYSDVLSWVGKGKRSYDIILSGYYGFMNIGDDALLDSIINNLKHIESDIKILILSRNPVVTTKMIGVDSISRFNLFNIISTMKRSDLFIYGGGTLIQESSSTRSLLYYLGTMYLAKLLGLKTMLYANGIQMLKKRFNRLVTRYVMNKIDLITLREDTSLGLLESLNINRPRIVITADPAVTTYPCSDKRVYEIFKREGIPADGNYLGVCVREWKGHEKAYSKVLADFADYLFHHFAITTVFIPMQRKYIDDSILSKNIARQMKTPSFILSEYYTAEETMGIISKMNILLGVRLHSLIFAACCNVPPIALVYESKVSSFMEYIGLDRLIAGDVSDITLENLISVYTYIRENETDIKDKLSKQSTSLRIKAIENASLAIELKNKKGEKNES